jgi:hypothetical protein
MNRYWITFTTQHPNDGGIEAHEVVEVRGGTYEAAELWAKALGQFSEGDSYHITHVGEA